MSKNIETSDTQEGHMHTSMQGVLGNRAPVPQEHKNWAYKLAKDIQGMDPGLQKPVIDILKNIKELDPEKAGEMARKISDFFHGIGEGVKGDRNDSQAFLDKISREVEAEFRSKIN